MSKMGWEGGGTRAALGGRRGEEEDNGCGEWGAALFVILERHFVAHGTTCATEMHISVAHPSPCATEIFISMAHVVPCATKIPPPNNWCRGPHKILWRMCPDAPLKCNFLWRIQFHAPQKRCGRMPSSRWWWGPHFFCGAWAPVRHRKYQFSGAHCRNAPQKSSIFGGASPNMRHRILSVAHGRFGAPQKLLPPIASFLVVRLCGRSD